MNSFPEKPEGDPSAASADPIGSALDAAVVVPAVSIKRAEPVNPPWSGWDVLRIVLIALLALFGAVVVLVLVIRGAGLRERLNSLNDQPELLILSQMAAYVLIIGYMYVLVTKERRQPRFWEAIEWNWPRHASKYILLGFLTQAVFVVLERFLPFPKDMPFDNVLKRPYSIALIAILSITLGPLMEELFFRGFFYPVLRRRFGVATAIVATALPFALMHAAQYANSWASVLLIFLVGSVLATVREKSASLGASFLVHVGYNGTIMAILFAATGGFRHLERLNH